MSRQNQIAVLRDRGYTVREIAKLVGLKSPGAVQFYLNRTKQGYKSRSALVKENQALSSEVKRLREEKEKQYNNLYCLVCAYEKERGVWDGQTGIYVCKECRDAGRRMQDAIETFRLIRKEQLERAADDSCDIMGEWAHKFLSSLSPTPHS